MPSLSYTPFYAAGDITLTNGSTTFTLATGALVTNARPGDHVIVAGEAAIGVIASITGETEGELLFAWAGSTVTTGDYTIQHTGPFWHTTAEAVTRANELLKRVIAGGNLWETDGQPSAAVGYEGDYAIDVQGAAATIYYKDVGGWDEGTILVGNSVQVGTSVPDNADGQDGDIYIRTSNGQVYTRVSGAWTEFAVLTGAAGPAGKLTAPAWLFSTTTTDDDPGDGNVRFNNANIESVSQIYIDLVTGNGGTYTAGLDTWDDSGDAGNRGTLFVVDRADASKWAYFRVNGSVVVATSRRKVSVTRLASNPSTGAVFSAGAELGFAFTPRGGTGDPGAAGFTPGKRFTFDSSATTGDPGAGRVRADNAAFGSITALLVSDVDALGANVEGWIAALGVANNASGRSVLTLQVPTTAADMTFAVTGAPVDEGGYWTVPVTPLSGDILPDEVAFTAWVALSGADGTDGQPGGQGIQGPASTPMAMVYAFDDETTDADPGTGAVRFNNADWSLVTAMYIADTNYAGGPMAGWISSWGVGGDAERRGTLRVIDVSNPANFLIASVTGSIVDGTDYRKVTLSVIEAGGTPEDDAQVGIEFAPAAGVTIPARLAAGSSAAVLDWNVVVDSGWYQAEDAEHAPGSGNWLVDVRRNNDTSLVHQSAVSVADATQRYWRWRNDEGYWSAWVEAAVSADLTRAATVAEASWRSIPEEVAEILVGGYAADGDGGGALYIRVESEPDHPGKFQSADGGWWEIGEPALDVRMFGALGDGTTDDRSAILAADVAAASLGAPLMFPAGTYCAAELEMTTGWYMLPGATLLYNGTLKGQVLRCAGTGLVSGDIRIDCGGQEPWTGLYLDGNGNRFRSVSIRNVVSTDQEWVVRGIYVIGNYNVVESTYFEDFVKDGNTNDSSPQGIVTTGTSTSNDFQYVFGKNARSVIVNNSLSSNFYGDIVAVDCKDNGFYGVQGTSFIGSLFYDGDDNACGFRHGANVSIGDVFIHRAGATNIFFGDCGDISIGNIFVHEGTNAILHLNSADTGHLRIGSIKGTVHNSGIFAMMVSNGDVESLSIDEMDVRITLDSDNLASPRHLLRLDSPKQVRFGRLKADVIIKDGYDPTDPFYVWINSALERPSSIDSFRYAVFEEDGVTPYAGAACFIIGSDGSVGQPLPQEILTIGEGVLNVNGYLRPYTYGDFQAHRLMGAAAPTVGGWKKGTIIWAGSSSATLLGWICTASGSPGTWAPLGLTTGGDYAPTVTAGDNVDAVSATGTWNYTVQGGVVTVSGLFNLDPNAVSTATDFFASLPIAATFANNYDACGTASRGPDGMRVVADTSNNRLRFATYSVGHTSGAGYAFVAQYRLND